MALKFIRVLEAALTWAQHNRAGQGAHAAGQVHHTAARKVHVTFASLQETFYLPYELDASLFARLHSNALRKFQLIARTGLTTNDRHAGVDLKTYGSKYT